MQNKLMIENVMIVQPDTYTASLATTSGEDSGRDMSFIMRNSPIGTAEAYQLEWTNISGSDAAQILQLVVGKSKFSVHYYSLYHGAWRTADFYAANYNTPVISLVDGQEIWGKLSFQITGVESII